MKDRVGNLRHSVLMTFRKTGKHNGIPNAGFFGIGVQAQA